MESLRAEAARLKRSGVDAVAAYTRQKERSDEVRTSGSGGTSIGRLAQPRRARNVVMADTLCLSLVPPTHRPAERNVIQLTEALLELQARYDAVRLSTAPTVGRGIGVDVGLSLLVLADSTTESETQDAGAARVAELEAAVAERDAKLRAAEVRGGRRALFTRRGCIF